MSSADAVTAGTASLVPRFCDIYQGGNLSYQVGRSLLKLIGFIDKCIAFFLENLENSHVSLYSWKIPPKTATSITLYRQVRDLQPGGRYSFRISGYLEGKQKWSPYCDPVTATVQLQHHGGHPFCLFSKTWLSWCFGQYDKTFVVKMHK